MFSFCIFITEIKAWPQISGAKEVPLRCKFVLTEKNMNKIKFFALSVGFYKVMFHYIPAICLFSASEW